MIRALIRCTEMVEIVTDWMEEALDIAERAAAPPEPEHNGALRRMTLHLVATGLAFGCWACTSSHEGEQATSTTTPSTTTGTATTTSSPGQVTAVMLTRHSDSPPYAIDIRYPQLNNPPPDARDRLNREIQADVERTASEFTTSAQPDESGDPEGESMLTGDFVVKLASSRWLSLHLAYDFTLTGAAHPWETWTTYNYDLSQGRRITVTDLFRPGTGWRQAVSNEARRQLRAQFQGFDDIDATRGRPFTDEELAPFSLVDNGLDITFEEYVVVPRVAGQAHVTIPFTVIERFLRLDWRAS